MEINPEKYYYQPQKILGLYEKRSIVIHGSDFGISSDKDYWSLLNLTKYTFDNLTSYAHRHVLNQQKKIYQKLLDSSHIIPFLRWLSDSFDDRYSKSIVESIKEDWSNRR